jgi:DNA-binding GntR family transcriptional regulator
MARSALKNLTQSTLNDQAYAAILRAIGAGELEPGQKVTERGLAKTLGVSPTPVREALLRLIQDGQVERVSPRTLRVVAKPQEALAEIDEIEVELRVLLARFAARKATPEGIAVLDALLDRADRGVQALTAALEAGEALDERLARKAFAEIIKFHQELERIAANDVLSRVLEQARAFSLPQRHHAVEQLTQESAKSMLKRYLEHRELLDAIRSNDEDAAAAIARRHVSLAHLEIRRTI